MIKKLNFKNYSEKLIIDKYLSRLNFNKKGTYNFKNDAAYIRLNKNKKLVVTTDSISENLDFFKNDDPKSIAHKIITVNLSDLSSMGVIPHSYLLNLFLPHYVNLKWIKIFTAELFKIQKKFNFYLLGGDLSKSKELSITSTFFGYAKNNYVVSQNQSNLNDDIWITGNIGDSFIGLQILKNKIKVNNKLKKYFIKKYYFPEACIYGSELSKFSKSMKDISDGFIGDLKKMLKNNYGAKIYINNIPVSNNLKKILSKNIININQILNCGDCYQLILISNKKFRNKIISNAKKNNIKITRVGTVIKNSYIIDDSNYTLNIPREFDHFL
tara:strand:+ start:74 stop:1054 length:981 start_codon:yes stop_codon:yes gene_type:complete